MFAPVIRSLRVLPLLLLAASAFAGDNPDIRAFVLFENDSNYIEPVIYETFTATIYLENFSSGGGVNDLAFGIDRTFEADLLGICYNLGEGTAVIGITFTGGIQVNGGGAYVSGSDVTFDRCVFTGNVATSNGGGVRIHGSDVLLRRCDLTDNIAGAAGGGLGITSSTAVLESCLVGENLAGNAGGGLHFSTNPLFCRWNAPGDPYSLDGASSCAPAQQPSCGLVGARGVGCDVTGVAEDAPPSPPSYRLYANRPNPFNPTTTIRFDLPREERVTLLVYDVTGRRVAVLAGGRFGPGAFERVWRGVDDSGRAVASGVYFARLTAGDFTAVRKMVLLR